MFFGFDSSFSVGRRKIPSVLAISLAAAENHYIQLFPSFDSSFSVGRRKIPSVLAISLAAAGNNCAPLFVGFDNSFLPVSVIVFPKIAMFFPT